jgi:hypothetical protein
VRRGRARCAGHRIEPRRTKSGFGDVAGNIFLSGAPQIPLRDGLGNATGDALRHLFDSVSIKNRLCLILYYLFLFTPRFWVKLKIKKYIKLTDNIEKRINIHNTKCI